MAASKRHTMILLLILLLGAGLRLYRLGALSLWFDEALSVLYTDSFENLLPGTERGTDSPLFLFFLYLWRQLGTSLFFLRLLPAIFGVATIWAAYRFSRDRFGGRIGLAVACAVAIAPVHIYYSQELRSYSLLALVSTLAMHALFRCLERGRTSDWVRFTIYCIACIYTHYGSGVLILAMNFYALWKFSAYRHRLRAWLICHGAMAIAFAPWILHFVRQFAYQVNPQKQGEWVSEITLHKLATAITDFTFGFHLQEGWVVVAMSVFGLCLILYGTLCRRDAQAIAFLYFIVMALVIGISLFLLNIFVARYFIYASVPFYILVALGIASLPRAVPKGVVVAILLTTVTIGNVRLYQNTSIQGWVGLYTKRPYDKAFRLLDKEYREGDLVCHHHENSLTPFKAYQMLWGSRFEDNWLLMTQFRIVEEQATWYPGLENAPKRLMVDPEKGQLLVCSNMVGTDLKLAQLLDNLNPKDLERVLAWSKKTGQEILDAYNRKEVLLNIAGPAWELDRMTPEQATRVVSKRPSFEEYDRIWYIAGFWEGPWDWFYRGTKEKRDAHEEVLDWLDKHMTLVADYSKKYGFGIFRLYQKKSADESHAAEAGTP